MTAEMVDTWLAPDPDGPLSWQQQALCAQTDPEAFFPEKGGSTREAKRICIGCEVKTECLTYALDQDERFGIWGGLSERERRRLKRTGDGGHLALVGPEDDDDEDEEDDVICICDAVPADRRPSRHCGVHGSQAIAPHVDAMTLMHQAAVRSQVEQMYVEHQAEPQDLEPELQPAPSPQRALWPREPIPLDWDSLSLIPELCGPASIPAQRAPAPTPAPVVRLTKAQRQVMRDLLDQGYSKERSRRRALVTA
jgi:WhiB family redox-sensing transcriptional regulator